MAEHQCFSVSTTAYMRNFDPEEGGEVYAVHYQRPPVKLENGGTSFGLVFPTLIVSAYMAEPEKIAQRVAGILNQHWDGWRPIETAPKDGTVIDVWREYQRETVYWGFPPHECGEMGQYCDSDWHSIRTPGWICSTFGEFVGGEHDPFTHWMPIQPGPGADNG
jgi:hypothetical protein